MSAKLPVLMESLLIFISVPPPPLSKIDLIRQDKNTISGSISIYGVTTYPARFFLRVKSNGGHLLTRDIPIETSAVDFTIDWNNLIHPVGTSQELEFWHARLPSGPSTRYGSVIFTLREPFSIIVNNGKFWVNMNGAPSITFGGSSVTGGKAPYTYSWSPATGLSNPNILNPICTTKNITTYTLTVHDSSSPIRQSASRRITVYPDVVVGLRDCRNFAGNNVQITKGREDNRYCNYTANDINGLSYRWESLTSGAYVRGSSTSVVVLSVSNSPIYYTVRLTVSQTTSSGTCSSSKTVSGRLGYTWNHGGFGNGGSSNTGRGGGRLMAKPEPIEKTKASEPAEKYAYQASPIVNSYPNPAKGQLRVSILEKIDDEAFAARSSGNKKQEIEWISSQDISANGDVRLPQPATLVLYDRNLQVRYQGESQISPATIPLEGLSQGIYFLHVNYKGKTRQQKIVVD